MMRLYFVLSCAVFVSAILEYEHNCGDGKCTCSGIEAYCQYNIRLSYIPKLEDYTKKVYFDFNYVPRIESKDFFMNVTNITTLSLGGNSISYIAPGVFDGLKNLIALDLNDNALFSLPDNLFSHETRSRLLHFDAWNNPFQCTCDLMWLSDWLISSPSVFSNSPAEVYTCTRSFFCDTLSSVKIVELSSKNEQACLLSCDSFIVIYIILCVLLLLLFLFIGIRIFCPIKHTNFRQSMLRPFRILRTNLHKFVFTANVEFRYDLFVSYAEEDREIVLDHLRPRLETDLGLRLCLHQRDFHPGRDILGNIDDCVTSSKKFLMVFSSNFARSPWCQFELALCQRHVMDRDDTLLVVHVTNTPVSDVTPSMAAILRTCTYIPWTMEGEDETLFWNSLLRALKDLTPHLQPRPQHQQQRTQRQQRQRQQRQGDMDQDGEELVTLVENENV